VTTRIASLALAAALCSDAFVSAQAPAPVPVPPPPRFSAQLRPPDDPQLVARGRRVYDISCRSCHGADLRGGDMGGPNLLRSEVALNDEHGERLAAVIQGSRPGMPAVPLEPDDVAAVAAYVHSVLAQGRAQGAPPMGSLMALNLLVGDAEAGQAYFAGKCAACHSTTGDLQGVGSRMVDPMQLQNLWVAGQRPDPPDPNRPVTDRDVIVVVTPESGRRIEGRLERIDDFSVSLLQHSGVRRTIRRVGDMPRVEIRDPLATHKQLLQNYSDRDIHNVTAYLMTLK
jgi:cytochrome c oxidase cbb3-type subunit 3